MRINDHYKIDLKRSTPWETKLAALAQAEQALAATQGSLPPLPTRLELQNPAADLPALWRAPTASHTQGPQTALRTLIADVTLLPETDPAQAGVGIRWHTGATDQLAITRPLPPGPAKRSPSPAVERGRGATTSSPASPRPSPTAGSVKPKG